MKHLLYRRWRSAGRSGGRSAGRSGERSAGRSGGHSADMSLDRITYVVTASADSGVSAGFRLAYSLFEFETQLLVLIGSALCGYLNDDDVEFIKYASDSSSVIRIHFRTTDSV